MVGKIRKKKALSCSKTYEHEKAVFFSSVMLSPANPTVYAQRFQVGLLTSFPSGSLPTQLKLCSGFNFRYGCLYKTKRESYSGGSVPDFNEIPFSAFSKAPETSLYYSKQ